MSLWKKTKTLFAESWPVELLEVVTEYLDHADLHSFEATCRRFRENSKNHGYWRFWMYRSLVFPLPQNAICNVKDWKSFACAYHLMMTNKTDSISLLYEVVEASSVDREEVESASNTLQPSRCFTEMVKYNDNQVRRFVHDRTFLVCGCTSGQCYWSSKPSYDPVHVDYIDYSLRGSCILRGIQVVPYRACWQLGQPTYAPRKISISLYSDRSQAPLYTSPLYDIKNAMELQCFELPQCVYVQDARWVLRLTMYDRHQYELQDDDAEHILEAIPVDRRKYYCCMSFVGINGSSVTTTILQETMAEIDDSLSPLSARSPPRQEPPMAAKNYLIHKLYLRHEYTECLRLIEEMLKEYQGLCEYPIYVKALIMQRNGRIQESLQLFQAATCLNPENRDNLKQVGRSLYLLGKHKAAIEVYEETIKLPGLEDWEIHHNIGLCYMYLKDYDHAIESFQHANNIHRHDTTYLQLGKVHTLRDDFKAAINVYLEALEFSPENPELLTTIGLLYLRIGENFRAFDYLGNSMTHDPRNAKTILAAGSIIQDHGDMDVALVKYRVAAVQTPNSAQLWNNIGMCFFGKQRYVAAVASLKRALYLDPFEWITSYNLGLVHLNTGQYASAFHYFSAAINLKPDFPSSYMYLAITLGRLDDFENACSAYDKAIEMETDHMFHLNYALTLFNNDELERAKVQFDKFETIFESLDEATRTSDPDVMEQRQALLDALSNMS
ncbi:sporangia induced Bardet-Biedl syndrome 4 protein, partial [Thraustotheca clavata]